MSRAVSDGGPVSSGVELPPGGSVDMSDPPP
jgi:hypothetical protein